MDNPVYGFDTETTGVDTATAKVLEVALVGNGVNYVTLVACDDPIPPDASGIHHICKEDLIGAPDWNYVKSVLADTLRQQPLPVLVAHNCEYDKAMLGEFEPVLWVCTYKAALRLFPDAPSHKNESLYYYLGLPNRGRRHSTGSHSAGHDASRTLELYHEFLKYTTLAQMLAWTELPKMFKYMPFGKHKGKEWKDIDVGYMNWCLAQRDMSEDIKYACRNELDRRRRG